MAYELHYGDAGTDVRRLQEFLLAEHGAMLSADGVFGPNTRKAIVGFQNKLGLEPTGGVNAITFDALARQGLVLLSPPVDDAKPGSKWPPRPIDLPQPDPALTTSLFGTFRFKHTPTPTLFEKIQILDGWEEENIVELKIPQLDRCLFAVGNRFVLREVGLIRCHKLAAPKFKALFEQWEGAELLDRVLTCAGAFNARLKMGSKKAKPENLSNHSWGTAIDLNNRENSLSHVPVGVGARGCLRELVKIANGLGFYWGGHFKGRLDGMHFELAKLD